MAPQWVLVQGRFSFHSIYTHIRRVMVVDIMSSQRWAGCKHSEQNGIVQSWDQQRSWLQLLKRAAIKTPRNIITQRRCKSLCLLEGLVYWSFLIHASNNPVPTLIQSATGHFSSICSCPALPSQAQISSTLYNKALSVLYSYLCWPRSVHPQLSFRFINAFLWCKHELLWKQPRWSCNCVIKALRENNQLL